LLTGFERWQRKLFHRKIVKDCWVQINLQSHNQHHLPFT
jgi:hypothetical protein